MRMPTLRVALAALMGLLPALAFDTQRIPVPSAAMGIAPKATVVLPDGYARGDRRYPVVYVLHGWAGDDTDWTRLTGIGKLADQYGMILVMPDGAYDKWYIDSPVNPSLRYETYVGKELVAHIDRAFRTKARRASRAITGLSMGGFGALNIAVNNPDTFCAAGSLSGAVDPRPQHKDFGLEAVFGDPVKQAAFWNSKAIITNAERFKGIALTLDCGVDDFLIETNRALHQRLLQLKVPHDYQERPGQHNWDYWGNAIKYQALFFAGQFKD